MTGREHTQPLGATIIGEWRHELRTPVNQILGYAEMLLEDTEPESAESTALESIIAQARVALAKVNDGLPPSGQATEGALLGVLDALVIPRDAIVEATQQLLAGTTDAQLMADLDRIASAARRLTARPTVRHTPAESAPVAPSVPIVGIVGPPATILVVDDVEENRAVLARRIEKLGHNVETAASGFEALDRVERGTFDLVLLDVLMPGMDGLEVLARLKAGAASRRIPVIMISALDDLTAVVRCIEAGAEDYLTKPFDPVLLRARIGACLEKKRLHDREADYLRQVTRVIDVAADVEQGRYAPGALDALARRDDELGRLARVFDSMAAGVQARESRLLHQLHELRDEIVLATREHPAMSVTDEQQADPFRAGDVLAGRYEIRETIGHGGMGVVYRAHDRELGEEVAIKMLLRAALGDDPDALERFKTEIRLARRISHRNVVRTHDFGEADGIHFVTMECVRGLTVRDLLTTRGRLGPSSALALIRQLVDALDVAHVAGVIHRDVKPENALLDGDGVLKVTDFGIARLSERTSTRTMTGMILGTPSYMSPEQLLGEEIDARADLYAVGVVLYECLTGVLPFTAPSPVALIGKVLSTSAPSPAALNPDVPPALASLVLRLLAKQPGERPGSARALAELLAELA